MAINLKPGFDKYCVLNDDCTAVVKYKCPVEGCSWETDQGAGSLRMHLLISADEKCKGRYCPKHHEFLKTYPDELTLEGVRYLAQFPSTLHLDTGIKGVRE